MFCKVILLCLIFSNFHSVKAREAVASGFGNIYKNKEWGTEGGGSGSGSTLEYTAVARQILGDFIVKHDIKSMADVPCGSFHWMHSFLKNHTDIEYHGFDVVDLGLTKRFVHNPMLHFNVGDVSEVKLPKVDLMFSRDALQHLSMEVIIPVLKNIQLADPKFLLVGSYPSATTNRDINIGDYFPINLLIEPFNLCPALMFDEHSPDGKWLYMYTQRQIRNWFKS